MTLVKQATTDRMNLTLFTKASRDEWESMEKPVDAITQQILVKMTNYGHSDTSLDSKMKTYGELLYTTIVRDILCKQGYVAIQNKIDDQPKQSSKSKSKIQVSKLDQMRMDNSKKTIVTQIKNLQSNFDEIEKQDKTGKTQYHLLQYDYGLSTDVIDLRIITMLHICTKAIEQQTKYNIELKLANESKNIEIQEKLTKQYAKLEEMCYKIVLSIMKLCELLEETSASNVEFKSFINSTQKCKVSISLMQDLTIKFQELKQACNFNATVVFNKYPWLIDANNLYKITSEYDIKLHKCQEDLLKLVKSMPNYLCMYKSNFGSGKTTATIGVVAQASQLSQPALVVYCCNSKAVRHSVCQMAYNASIKFAIATMTSNVAFTLNPNDSVSLSAIRIINNYLCKTDADRQLIVADYVTTFNILLNSKKILNVDLDNIILIIDEPTDGTDDIDNEKTKYVVSLIFHAPKRLILMSATLPSISEIEPCVKYYTSKHRCEICIISNDSVKIGCELILHDGTTFMPHNECKTKNDLEKVISKLQINKFIGRLYTANIMFKLFEIVIKLNPELKTEIKKRIDLNQIFNKYSSFNHTTIINIIINLFEFMMQSCSDDQIEKICKTKITNNRHDVYESSIDRTFDICKITTSDAFKFVGTTLVIHDKPDEIADTMFNETKFETTAQKLIAHYKKTKMDNEKRFEKHKKSLDKMSTAPKKKKTKTVDEDDNQRKKSPMKISGEELKLQKERELETLMSNNVFDVDFPSKLQINTFDHLESHKKLSKIANKKYVRQQCYIDTCPLDANISDNLMLYRFSGVGIYNPNAQYTDCLYDDDVVKNTLNGKLAYVLSDRNITYGVNSPAENIIVCDSILKSNNSQMSINGIFQLLARVGRPNLSWSAQAYIGDNMKQTLINYIYDIYSYSPEAENMNRKFVELQYTMEQILDKNAITSFANAQDAERFLIIKNEKNGFMRLCELYKQETQKFSIQVIKTINVVVEDFQHVIQQNINQHYVNQDDQNNKLPSITCNEDKSGIKTLTLAEAIKHKSKTQSSEIKTDDKFDATKLDWSKKSATESTIKSKETKTIRTDVSIEWKKTKQLQQPQPQQQAQSTNKSATYKFQKTVDHNTTDFWKK